MYPMQYCYHINTAYTTELQFSVTDLAAIVIVSYIYIYIYIYIYNKQLAQSIATYVAVVAKENMTILSH